MKPTTYLRSGRIALLALSSMSALTAFAQSGPQLSPTEAIAVSRTNTFSQAVSVLRAGRLSEAEAILVAANRMKSGSAAWYFESASDLMRAAMVLRQTGQAGTAVVVAQRAMVQLALAEKKLVLPGDNGLAAAIKQSAGLMSERLVGTSTEAKNYYRAAILLDSKSPAGAALSKLELEDQAVASRQAAKPTPRG